ncbi:MAG: histidine phosphatase family protein [Bacteroidia bacterium]|nr:histidine phosphatase family protein [Bacteroidia bacterium]
MKKLYITRHAKSDWGFDGLKDIDRPLNQRGYDDAYRLSAFIKKKEQVPQLLVSSPAIRAISTALIFARNFSYPENEIKIVKEIYESSVATLKQCVTDFSEDYSSIMLFGHNPGLTKFFNEVSDSEIDNLPTCAVTLIEFDAATWKNVFKKEGKTIFTEFPKEFKP